MPDYKAIHGRNIQHLASDLDSAEGEGQIWFNTATSDYKTIVKVAGAWSTGGNLNTARSGAGSAGAGRDSAVIFGGEPGSKNESEEYNGTTWTEGNNLTTARSYPTGTGIQTAALALAGHDGTAYVAIVEQYDGTSWTEIADMNTGRSSLASAGTTTAALSFAGSPYPTGALTELWNGSSWTEVGDLSQSRYGGAGTGTQTAAMLIS